VVKVPGLQRLLKYICKNGFEHHVAINGSRVAGILTEAFETYFGWDTYYHQSNHKKDNAWRKQSLATISSNWC